MNFRGLMVGEWKVMLPQDQELPPLHLAARRGDLQEVSRCLKSGADANSLAIVQRSDKAIEWMHADTRAESRLPALHAAVVGGEIAVVRGLLDYGADPKIRWHCVALDSEFLPVGDFGTALVLAARANRVDIMTLLIERGVSPDADPEILPELAAGNQAAALGLLLARTALPVDCNALLETAARNAALEVTRLLLNLGGTRKQTGAGEPSTQITTEVSDSLPARLPQAQQGISLQQRMRTLYTAAEAGHTEIVQLLLESGLPSEAKAEAFRKACRSSLSTLSTMRLLLEPGAVLCVDNENASELYFAVKAQKENRARLLLEHGASVHGRYQYRCVDRRLITQKFLEQAVRPPCVYEQMTLLMLAAGQGAVPICQLLLDYGADPNAQDAEGYTPLWYAVQERTGVSRLRAVDPDEPLPPIDVPGVVRLLISQGASADVCDPQGRTLLEWFDEMRPKLEAVYPENYIQALAAAIDSILMSS